MVIKAKIGMIIHNTECLSKVQFASKNLLQMRVQGLVPGGLTKADSDLSFIPAPSCLILGRCALSGGFPNT
jgi:hypothetical protein